MSHSKNHLIDSPIPQELNFSNAKEARKPQDSMEEKVRLLLTEAAKEGSGFHEFVDFTRDLKIREKDENGESEWDRAYRALLMCAKDADFVKDPHIQGALIQLEDLFGQDSQVLSPHTLIDGITDVNWRADVPASIKGSTIRTLGYYLAFFPEDRLWEELKPRLDFEHSESFFRTGATIEMLGALYNTAQNQGFKEDVVMSKVLSLMEDVTEQKKGSYLLNARAESLLNSIRNSGDAAVYADVVPFEIAAGLYGVTRNGGVWLVPPQEVSNAKELTTLHSVMEQAYFELIDMPDGPEREQYWDALPWTRLEQLGILEGAREIPDVVFNVRKSIKNLPLTRLQPNQLFVQEYLAKANPEMVEQEMFDYEYLVTPAGRELLKNDFGFEPGQLHLEEQQQFLSFLKSKDLLSVDAVKEFCKQYGVDGLRTFLATGAEAESTNHMVRVSNEKKNTEHMARIFKLYTEIVDASYAATNYAEVFRASTTDADVQVRAGIRSRAKKFLLDSVSGIEQKPAEVIATLERMKTDAVVFAAAFRTLKEGGEIDLESIRDVSFATESSTELSENAADVEKITTLLEEAYKDKDEEFRKKVIGSFQLALKNPDSRFYVLRRQAELAAVLRFDDVRNEEGVVTERYAGSFVADNAYANGKLGEAIFEKAFEVEKGKGLPITADCVPNSPISRKYIEDGFVATALKDYGGLPLLSIVLDDHINSALESRSWKTEDIVRAALTQNGEHTKTFSTATPEEIPFHLVNEGYALTRYLKVGNRVYVVFEAFSPTEKGSA